MKTLETIFFVLMLAVPAIFIVLGLINIDKVKKNTRFRNTLIKMILASLLINGLIWGALTISNDKRKINERYGEKNDNQDSSNRQNDLPTDPKDDEHTDKDTPNDQKEPDPIPDTPAPDTPSNSTTTTKPVTPPNQSSTGTSTFTASKPPKPTEPATFTGTTSKGFPIETINGVTYVDGYLIVNKTYPLPSDYVPNNTYKPITQINCADCLDKQAIDAYQQMKKDASSNGHGLWVASGYRGYTYQAALYNGYVANAGKAEADTYSARPGHSEHQSGFAFDLNDVNQNFGNTPAGQWINQNCYKYGFIIRYPQGKDNETGYIYEPWHLRYVGIDLATKLYNAGDWITMESYFGLTSQYQD